MKSLPSLAIVLSGKIGGVAIIDAEDYSKIKNYTWSNCKGYARTAIGDKTVHMHQIIMNSKPGEFIHHANRNPLDNRKANLVRLTSRTHHKALHRKGNAVYEMAESDLPELAPKNDILPLTSKPTLVTRRKR